MKIFSGPSGLSGDSRGGWDKTLERLNTSTLLIIWKRCYYGFTIIHSLNKSGHQSRAFDCHASDMILRYKEVCNDWMPSNTLSRWQAALITKQALCFLTRFHALLDTTVLILCQEIHLPFLPNAIHLQHAHHLDCLVLFASTPSQTTLELRVCLSQSSALRNTTALPRGH